MVVTLTALRAEAKKLNMSVSRDENGEFRVAFPGNYATSEPSAYYTDDAEDALGTMKLMAKEPRPVKRNPMKRHKAKKPAFGKRKAAKLRATPTRDHRRARTKFSVSEGIRAMRNPSLGSRITRYVVRAVKFDGDKMYFDGCNFRGDKKKAAIFTGKAGEEVMERLERDHAAFFKKNGVDYLDVVQA